MTWIKTSLKSVAFIAFVSVGFAFGTAGGIVALIVSYAVASRWEEYHGR